jgi:bifunctional DNA-binding transcriptional regulator/antitoxin component of YhaV-PrlF toxin-antitoxin module
MDVDAEDGRIYLPKRLREKFGHRFELVDRGDRLVLIPIAADPLEALRDEFHDVDASAEELKQGALDEALDEAGS